MLPLLVALLQRDVCSIYVKGRPIVRKPSVRRPFAFVPGRDEGRADRGKPDATWAKEAQLRFNPNKHTIKRNVQKNTAQLLAALV